MSAPNSAATGRRRLYAVLLGAIILVFAIQGIASPGRLGQILITVLLGVTLLLALSVANLKRGLMRPLAVIVGALVLAALGAAIADSVGGGPTRVTDALLVVLAPPAIILGVVRDLRRRQAVTVEAVLGVLSFYILLGMLFGFVFGSVDRLGGSPFFAGGEQATVARCLYFSFATLTTAGYGDLTARTNLGHTLSVSEALLGQIYLVTVVSLIVANLGRGRVISRP